MTTKQEPAVLAFTATEFVTILMALEASMFLAATIGNQEEHDAARDLRAKFTNVIAARMAMNEKTGEKVH